MTAIKRMGIILLTSCAGATLAACDGADSVASPGSGTVVINPPPPAPSPTPSSTATPTPTPITASQFAVTSGGTGSPAGGNATIAITADEQLAFVTGAPGSNNNPNGTRLFAAGNGPNVAAPMLGAGSTLPTATDPTTLNAATGQSFFQAGTYLGAFSSASDTSFQGWTCNSPSATFNPGATTTCNSPPLTVAAAATPAASACPTGTTDAGVNTNVRLCRMPNAINTDLTLPFVSGVAYLLDGNVEVGVDVGPTGTAAGGVRATLTIAAGVTIVANPADPANDVLLVNRGSMINAVGTATQPIIFTSRQNLSATGTSDATQGQWGGVILLGQAPTGVCRSGTGPNNAAGTSTTCENTAEGLTTTRLYGGPDQASNSGRMQFVQIRFTGIDISAGGGNELQGLTLGGTGSGTTLDHIQSHNSADDGIEIFGGTTNLRYIALTGADDDGYDLDNGYRGLTQFLVVAQRPNGSTSDSFTMEVDSNGSEDLLPRTFPQISNFTFIHTAATVGTLRLRGGTDIRLVNGVVQSTVPCLNIIAQANNQADRSTVRPADATLQDVGPPIFTSIYFACNNR